MAHPDRPALKAEVRALLDGKVKVTLIPPTGRAVRCVGLRAAHCVCGWHEEPVETQSPLVVTFGAIHFASAAEAKRAGYDHVALEEHEIREAGYAYRITPELFRS